MNATITITQDNATPAVAELMSAVSPPRLALICRDPLRGFWRDRLKNFPRLPGKFAAFPSTGFGEAAAESVEAFAGEGTVTLTANQIGLQLRYAGGTIKPVNAKVLCFGITEETYGKSYHEMMAQVSSQKVTESAANGKKISRRKSKDEAAAELRKKFAFAKSVTFAPNPAIVPSDDEFSEVTMAAISRALAGGLA